MSEPIIQGGCFLVSRQLMNSGIMNKPPEYLKVWIHLLSNAYFKDKEGLKRGQGFTSLEKLREVLSYKVGYRTETPTKKKVYGIIEWLRNPNEGTMKGSMIVTTKVTHGFVYTVVNYDLYQNISNYEGNNEGTAKVQRRESKGNNIKKNVKECKNEKNEIKKTKAQIFQKELENLLVDRNIFEPVTTSVKEFVENRKAMKKPMTILAVSKFLNKLEKETTDTKYQIELIDNAIASGWQTIYPNKNNGNYKKADIKKVEKVADF